MPDSLIHPFAEPPAIGESAAVATGVRWVRMPLPFALNHINLWILDDGPGRTLVDCGIKSDETRAAWERIFEGPDRRPIERLIVTHHHPDHIGLAGWLAERWRCPLLISRDEWMMGRLNSLDDDPVREEGRRRFFTAHGANEALVSALVELFRDYGTLIEPIPSSYQRLIEGDRLSIDRREWRVIVGTGHAPEHACLYCAETGTLIAGDQVLPRISTNISVWDDEPEADPLGEFLGSLDKLATLPAETFVLPSHGLPFHGLHKRIAALKAHHADRLTEARPACMKPKTAVEMMPILFPRTLDLHQQGFALGETLAHLNHLVALGDLERTLGDDGIYSFQTTDAGRTGSAPNR